MPRRSLLTVVFSDICGSTEEVAAIGDDAWAAILAQHDALLARRIDSFGGRVSQHVINGRSLRAIAAEVGISSSRAAEIYHREVRKQKRWAEQYHPTSPYLGRPIDMGGPRDVWLTFYPSPDPRFDNMEPATGE